MKKYMVIELFHRDCRDKIYQRFSEKGRMLPGGLCYIDSWLENDGDRCFQLMETENPDLFLQWISCWDDLTTFEVVEIGEKPSHSVNN